VASPLSLSPLRLSFCCLQARLNEHPRAGPPASPARWSLPQRGGQESSGIVGPRAAGAASLGEAPLAP
jgi:hypothetical protein